MIRKCQGKDVQKLFEVFGRVYKFNPNLLKKDYFDWQFKDTPFYKTEEYNFFILWKNDLIKAFVGYVPFEFRFKGDIYSGCWVQNLYSEEGGASGLKVLTHLMSEYDNRFFTAMTQEASYIYKMYRIPILPEMNRIFAVLNYEKFVSLLTPKGTQGGKEKLRESFEVFKKCNRAERESHNGWFDENEEFFFNAWPKIKGYCRRTGRYLNWRYRDIPGHNYKVLRINDQYAIYRIEPIMHHNASVTKILEWNVYGENAENVLTALRKDSLKNGSILIDFFCTAGDITNDLIKFGFIYEKKLEKQIPYIFRPICLKEQGIPVGIDMPPHRQERRINFQEWYITAGSSDIDRIKL